MRNNVAYLLVAIALAILPTYGKNAMAAEAHVLNVINSGTHKQLAVSARTKGAFTKDIRNNVASGAPLIFTYTIELKRHRTVVWDETVREFYVKKMVKFNTLTNEYQTWQKEADDEADIDFAAEIEAVNYKEPEKKIAPENDSKENKHDGIQTQPASSGQLDKPVESETVAEDEAPAEATVMEPLIFTKQAEFEKWMSSLEKLNVIPTEGLDKSGRYYYRVKCTMKSIKLIPPFNYILFFIALLDFDTDWTSSTIFTINGSAKSGLPAKATQQNGKQTR